MLDFTIDESILQDLRLAGKELEVAQQRAIRDATRKLRTRAQRQVVAKTGLKPAEAKRRVLGFPGRGKLWLGANPIAVTALRRTRVRPERGRPGRNQVLVNGAVVPGAFARRSGGRSTQGLPFQASETGVTLLQADINRDVQQALEDARSNASEVLGAEFRARAEGVIRGRG